MERDYFDAKFEGLKELMIAQNENTEKHIIAVSGNVKAVVKELADHKESSEAHGRGAAEKNSSGIVAWVGLAVAAVLGVLEFGRHRTP